MATGDLLNNMVPDEVLPEKDVSTKIPSLSCQEIKERNNFIFSNENMPKRLTSRKKKELNFEDSRRENKNSTNELEKSAIIQESLTGDKLSSKDFQSAQQENSDKHSMERGTWNEPQMNGFSSPNNSTLLQPKDNLHIENGELKKRKNIKSDKPEVKNRTSVVRKPIKTSKESFEEVPLYTAMMTYLGFYLLMILGYINQIFFPPKLVKEIKRDGYVPLYDAFESFYLRYVYRRVRDCWNKPICSVPGAEVVLKDRVTNDYGWTFEFTGTETKCLNLGSYNYLGFAQEKGPCADAVNESIKKYGIATCSTNLEIGIHPLITKVEKLTAQFLGVEDCLVCGMGFATNALNLPTLMNTGCLVISDEKNHASVILGLRLSGATIKVFRHNNTKSLEHILREAIIYGHPRTRRPWKKIFIVVEGVYSMEGSIVHLPEIIELKKKYKAYLYLDEAHSIGAIGPNGRGVCDYYGLDTKDVDILMGTYTKSFGSSGGYLAGSKEIIDYLRVNSHSTCYASSMSPPVAQQIITSMEIIMGLDGTNDGKRRIRQLLCNTRYFRERLHKIGVIIYGNEDSPVIPLLVYMFSKIGAVVRTLCTRKIATVGVGFPATPLMEGRIRFCLSAAHTKEQLDNALDVIEEIAEILGLKYSQKPRITNEIIYGDLNVEED